VTSPFDFKNRTATLLDRLALRIFLLFLCVAYFYFLWRRSILSLIAGSALFLLVLLAMMLIEKHTLSLRDRLLRERIGGMIMLDELMLMPGKKACMRIRDLLCQVLDASAESERSMRYENESWLICCAQCLQSSSVSESDILSAHRQRLESGCDKCALASTSRFSPAAVRAAEWMDPPIRLITGRQLALLFGRLHPATDEEIAAHMARQKKPFSWQRIRALALSPAKLKRHLLCAFLLVQFYLVTGALAPLFASFLSFSLAILCARENRQSFRL